MSRTGVVGFIGGMDIPLIHKFEAGFRAGAEYAFKEDKIQGKVLVGYVGNTPAAWNDPAKAKEIAAARCARRRHHLRRRRGLGPRAHRLREAGQVPQGRGQRQVRA